MPFLKKLCVFCGSSMGQRKAYAEAAVSLARLLAVTRIELVYGGGNCGLMGILANELLRHGGKVTGVIPEALMAREVGHTGVTELHVVASMHERKALMSNLSDAFVALPGGFGTLEELFEVITWAQLGFHSKPVGLLNVERYFDPLVGLIEHAAREGFLPPSPGPLWLAESAPGLLLERLVGACAESAPLGWIDKEKI
jgi:uncharacterized protein (TIGR00730 family)